MASASSLIEVASLHVPIVEVVQGAGVVSRRTKLYIYDSLGRGSVYAENEMMYGKFYKQQYAITKRISNASACALGPCPCPVFRPRNLFKKKKQGLGTRLGDGVLW